MNTIEGVLGDATPFLEKTFATLKQDKIDISKYELDHICYRVDTVDRYNELKQEILNYGALLSESQIGGRAISTFKLNEPIIFENREIRCIELPSSKEGSFYPAGYEHVEFVIDLEFEKFMSLYSHISFNTKSISKKVNPTIAIKYDGISVKFHQYSLEYVIEYLE